VRLPDRVLTMTEPWASFVFRLPSGLRKNVENRTRNIGFFDSFWISTSARCRPSDYAEAVEFAVRRNVPFSSIHGATREMMLGKIIGRVECCAVVTSERVVAPPGRSLASVVDPLERDRVARWWTGPYGYILRDPVLLDDPVPCRGYMGFWRLTASLRGMLGVR